MLAYIFPVIGVNIAKEAGSVLNQHHAPPGRDVGHIDNFTGAARLGIIGPLIVRQEIVVGLHGQDLIALAVGRSQHTGVLFGIDALFFPLREVFGAVGAMHAVEREKGKGLRAFRIAIAVDQAIRRPHLCVVALVAVTQVPGRFQTGLRVVRVEHRKRLAGHIVLKFALPDHDTTVVLERRVNKGLSERQVRGLLHGNRKVTRRQIGQNLRRQDRRGG